MYFKKIDLALFLPAILLAIIGSIILFSVAPSAFPLQFVYLGLALLIFYIFTNINIRVIKSLSPVFYVISILLLLVTYLFGGLSRGAVRWIDFGFITIQTSEIVKPLLLIFFANLLSNDNPKRFYYACITLIFPFMLVFIQPDLGSAIVLGFGFLGAIFMSGLPVRFILTGLVLFLIVIPISWSILADYQKQRIFSFLDPQANPQGSGYNSIQAVIAVGNGEFMGRGLGQGTQSQLLFLPESHTDFILSSISEELGFIGASLVIICFTIMLLRVVYLSRSSKDIFAQTLLGAVFFTIFAQSFINIGMNLGILPITGIPLPFVSSGGSALLAMSMVLGIASSLSYSLKSSLRSSII